MKFCIEMEGVRKTFAYGWLSLNYYAMLYGLSGKRRKVKVEELLDLFELRDFARIPFDGLSTGTKQKLSLAKSLLNEPDLLFLDEPTVGLDPDVVHRVWESIKQIHHEKASYTHTLLRGYLMIFLYMCLEVLLLKAAIRRAKRKGILLILSE